MNEQIANNQRRDNQRKQERRSDNRRREEQRKDNNQAKQQPTDNKSAVENKPVNPIVASAQRNNSNLQAANRVNSNQQTQHRNNNGVGNPQASNKVNSNPQSQENDKGEDRNISQVPTRPNNAHQQQKEGNNIQRDNKAKDRVQNRKVKAVLPEREEKGDNYKNDVPQPIRSIEKKDRVALRVGITHGDFNGVSYEIMFKSLFNSSILDICKPIVYGHSKIAAELKKRAGISGFGFSFVKQAEQAVKNDVYLVNVSDKEYEIQVGQVTKEAGELAFLALERAVNDIKVNKIDVIVTAPINKNAINQAVGFDFPGHTEYFADRFSAENKTLMLMVADNLRIAVATNHVPVDKLNEVITKRLIIDKVNILNNSLKRDFAIDMPKIAVLSLNPHAGDGGVIGNEELDVILPAVNELRDSGMIVNGPFAADGFFSSPNTYAKYDAVLAMYHDQGMIPFKMIAGDRGVNFTAGLPIVRTSPAHGTAFDIAGQNIASHTMLLEAIFSACDIYRNRKEYDALVENRLK